MELKDLVKYYVPMRMEGSSPPNWEVVFGYDISKFKGYNVDEGSAGEWKRAKKSGYLMLLSLLSFPRKSATPLLHAAEQTVRTQRQKLQRAAKSTKRSTR